MVKRGSQADFWRTAKVGLQLARWGWIPWGFEAFRRGRVREQVVATKWGCHASGPDGTPHGIASVREITRAGQPGRIQLSSRKRADLIRKLLPWLRARRTAWEGWTLDFRLERRFGAANTRWQLISDFYFYRGEGLYWNNCLAAIGRVAPALSARIEADLKGLGFRILRASKPREWVFDQDYISSDRVLKRAPALAAWRPSLTAER